MIEDFLGKVKNKAGDVEKILKEKDKHGKKMVEKKSFALVRFSFFPLREFCDSNFFCDLISDNFPPSSGILAKVKEGAEQVGTKIQAKVDTVVKQINEPGKEATDGNKRIAPRMEATHVMEVAQLMLSLIHSWGEF